MDAKLSGDLFKLGAQTAQYALGLQARNESLSRTPAEKPGSGDISGAGGAAFAIDKSRNATGGFAELSLPFTKELEANISARSDKYSDMGNASTYKVSGRWQPSPLFVVRASTNTGFRAPTLPELFRPQILQSSEQFNDNGPGGTGQTDLQVNATVGGNPNLRPETSTASSVGLVISPMKDFSFGLDWFQIKISDIIQTPGVQEVVSGFRKGDPAFAGLVKLAPGSNDIDSVTVLTSNLGKAEVSGIDVFANYRQSLGNGRLDIALNGTLMNQFDQTSPGGFLSHKVGTIVEEDGTPVLGADRGGVILKWKHTLSATWTQGQFAGTLTQNYSDKYRAGNDLNDQPVYVNAQSIYDLNLAYKVSQESTVMLGLKNIFDTQPGVFVPASNQFQQGYDVSQYDPRGRFFYVSAKIKF
jgi:iron complex outermembrane receptor protein